jgi:hypothetical protein
MSRLADRADSPSATCPYTLTKKNTGMNTIIATPRIAFSTANARLAKMRTLTSGGAVRLSTIRKQASSTAPATMQPTVAGAPQPHSDACCRPKTLSPTPPAISTSPR